MKICFSDFLFYANFDSKQRDWVHHTIRKLRKKATRITASIYKIKNNSYIHIITGGFGVSFFGLTRITAKWN